MAGTDILKSLFKAEDTEISVRALNILRKHLSCVPSTAAIVMDQYYNNVGKVSRFTWNKRETGGKAGCIESVVCF